jgi:hypothetical protein
LISFSFKLVSDQSLIGSGVASVWLRDGNWAADWTPAEAVSGAALSNQTANLYSDLLVTTKNARIKLKHLYPAI